MTTLLGLAMIYVWGHSVYSLMNSKEGTRTTYEKVLIVISLMSIALMIIGSSN